MSLKINCKFIVLFTNKKIKRNYVFLYIFYNIIITSFVIIHYEKQLSEGRSIYLTTNNELSNVNFYIK